MYIYLYFLNHQSNKHVTCVVSYYMITNWVIFEFISFNSFILRIVFELTNKIENLILI